MGVGYGQDIGKAYTTSEIAPFSIPFWSFWRRLLLEDDIFKWKERHRYANLVSFRIKSMDTGAFFVLQSTFQILEEWK